MHADRQVYCIHKAILLDRSDVPSSGNLEDFDGADEARSKTSMTETQSRTVGWHRSHDGDGIFESLEVQRARS